MVILIIVLIALGVISFFTYKKIKDILDNPDEHVAKEDAKEVKKEMTAQDYLQFKDIKDNVIDLGNDRYRMVIEVSSINFHLKTDEEKNVILMSYQNFLNSLTFPISIYSQTQKIDNTKMLKILEKDIEKTTAEFPAISTYGEYYLKEMKQIHRYTGSNTIKKKYIIVPFEGLEDLTELSKDEKYAEALKRINERVQIVIDGLTPIDLKGRVLNTAELAEFIYSSYNKDKKIDGEQLINGDFTQDIVTGTNYLNDVDSIDMTDFILYEAQNNIKNKVLNKNLKHEEREAYNKIIKHLGDVRSSVTDLKD